jgi:penicillin-binding protein activator
MCARYLLPASLALWFFFSGCFGGPGGPEVRRVAVDEEVRIGDTWNDTDSRLVSTEMVEDLLSRTWLDEWREKKQSKPRFRVGRVVNKSHDHIPTDTFIKDLERELINSGDVDFVASSNQKGALAEEKLYQAEAASLETQKAIGRELGADFFLVGQINSIVNQAGGKTLKFYQIELEVIDIETGVKVWMGQKKIKKVVERSQWDL